MHIYFFVSRICYIFALSINNLKTNVMSLTKNFYHDLICEQQNPEYDQYNYDVLAEQEYFDKQMQLQMASARENSRSLGTSKGTVEVTIN